MILTERVGIRTRGQYTSCSGENEASRDRLPIISGHASLEKSSSNGDSTSSRNPSRPPGHHWDTRPGKMHTRRRDSEP